VNQKYHPELHAQQRSFLASLRNTDPRITLIIAEQLQDDAFIVVCEC